MGRVVQSSAIGGLGLPVPPWPLAQPLEERFARSLRSADPRAHLEGQRFGRGSSNVNAQRPK